MRIANAKAVTYCNLFSLHTDDFVQVLEKYPDIKATFEKLVEKRRSLHLESPIINIPRNRSIHNMVNLNPIQSFKQNSFASIENFSVKF